MQNEFLASFPAAAGFQLVWLAELKVFNRQPIIGWLLKREHDEDYVVPVTTHGCADLSKRFDHEAGRGWVIVSPDGCVDDYAEGDFDSVEAFERQIAHEAAAIAAMRNRSTSND